MLDKGSGGFVRIAFGQITLDQLTSISIIDHQNNVSILPSTQQSTKIMVYVPKGLSKARTKEFLQLIKKEIDKKYPRAKFKIVPSYIEVKKHEEALDLQALIIRDMLRHPSNNLDASLLRNLLNTNLQLKSKLQQWKNSFAQKIKEIKTNPRSQDLMIGSVVGAGKSFFTAGYWLTITGDNIYGWVQTIFAIGMDQFFSRHVKKYNDFKANHQFPWFQNTFLLKHAVSYYNRNSYIKAFTIAQLVNFSITSFYRYYSYLNDPANINAPWSTEFLSTFWSVAIISRAINAYSSMGIRSLQRKGYISGRTEHYILLGTGYMSQLATLIIGSGNLQWLPMVLTVDWGIRATMGSLGRYLPPKGNRIYILHPDLDQEDQKAIEYVRGLEGALTNEDFSPEKIKETTAKFSYKLTPNFVDRSVHMLYRIAEPVIRPATNTIGSIAGSCRNLFSRKPD